MCMHSVYMMGRKPVQNGVGNHTEIYAFNIKQGVIDGANCSKSSREQLLFIFHNASPLDKMGSILSCIESNYSFRNEKLMLETLLE